jgi:hypothetical protein
MKLPALIGLFYRYVDAQYRPTSPTGTSCKT